jgi:hypothetical protein
MSESGSTSSERQLEESSEAAEYTLDEKPFQLVVRRRPRLVAYFRAKPRTAYHPTPAQVASRIAFAEAAKRARGMKLVGLPPAAVLVRESMRGAYYGGSPREPKWLRILRRLAEAAAGTA